MANVNMSKRLYCMQDGKDWNKEMLYFEDDEDIAKVRIDG